MAAWRSRGKLRSGVRSLPRPKGRPPGTEAVFNIVMNPIADGLDAREPVGDLPELIPRKFISLSDRNNGWARCSANKSEGSWPRPEFGLATSRVSGWEETATSASCRIHCGPA